MILAGIRKELIENENGEKSIYETKIVGSWEGNAFRCAEFVDDIFQGSTRISKEEFDSQVFDVREVF